MSILCLSNKDITNFTIKVREPLRPYALAYLAASGLFDVIALRNRPDSIPDAVIEGADLIRCADQVRPAVLPE